MKQPVLIKIEKCLLPAMKLQSKKHGSIRKNIGSVSGYINYAVREQLRRDGVNWQAIIEYNNKNKVYTSHKK